MKKTFIFLCIFAVVLVSAGYVFGVGGGKMLTYGGGGQGKVIFDGQTHVSKGLVCNDCHLSLFEMKKKALITMNDHNEGKACFFCHNGKQAFYDCGQCHRRF